MKLREGGIPHRVAISFIQYGSTLQPDDAATNIREHGTWIENSSLTCHPTWPAPLGCNPGTLFKKLDFETNDLHEN